MNNEPLAPRVYLDAIHQIEQALDAVVDHGSDDELFVASYLQGHFAVESKRLEMDDEATLEKLNDIMQASLNHAFEAGELESEDQIHVSALWKKLSGNL